MQSYILHVEQKHFLMVKKQKNKETINLAIILQKENDPLLILKFYISFYFIFNDQM